jgi:AcrR family transcriptional regulator
VAISDQRIFEAVLVVWNNRGFSQTTLKRVGEAAGLGELALSRRFGSKDELVRLAFTHAVEEFCRECTASGDLRSDLARFVEAFRSLLRRRGRLVLDFILEVSRTDQVVELVPVALVATNQIATIIAEHQAKGLLRGDNPWEPIFALIAPLFLPALQHDPQRKIYPSATGNIEEFLNGWASSHALKEFQNCEPGQMDT